MIAFFLRDRAEILRLTGQHLFLSGVSLGLALLVGAPLGVLLTRRRRLAPWFLGATATIQTVPSVALLGLLLLLPVIGGIGVRPAITALFLYALMTILESVYAGIVSVSPALVDVGRGLGMTELELLRYVELPQALPVLVAGLRMSTVLVIGAATVASYVGAGGLGDLIFRGVGRGDADMVAWGALPATALAVVAHLGLTALERRLARRRA
ncbi:MAG: ABC transporter permease [Elusimicrobia bacterium]|nr:ABC transporter permease [Elusimicrobiota bacterium]